MKAHERVTQKKAHIAQAQAQLDKARKNADATKVLYFEEYIEHCKRRIAQLQAGK